MTDNTGTSLAYLGAQLTKAREEEAKALARVMEAVKTGHARGVSEYKLAEQAQVSRSTIRAWLGKK